MGDSKGPIRLKGLFVFGAVTLGLGYAVPIAGSAAGPSASLGAASGPSFGAPPRVNPRSLYVGYSRSLAEEGVVLELPALEVPDPTLAAGTRRIEQPGVPGRIVRTLATTFEDDAAVETVLLSERTIPAVAEVIRVGTRAPEPAPPPAAPAPATPTSTAPGDPGLAGARAIAGSATSYCLTGRTATGTLAGPGSIAVDPAVIPLGSHLFVPGYGYGWAVDTGSAIRGTLVDLWLGCAAAIQWGRRAVTIYVLAS